MSGSSEKKAVVGCQLGVFGTHGLTLALAVLPQQGLHALQLTIPSANAASANSVLTSASSPDEVTKVRQQIEASCCRVVSCRIHTGQPTITAVRQILQRKMQLAADLGATHVIAEAGSAHSDSEREELYSALRQLGDHAATLGLIYCCDTLPGICRDHRHMLFSMGEINHPAVRLNFDPGQLCGINQAPVIDVALSRVCHLVSHVQLRDASGEMGDEYYPPLGYGGAVDLFRIHQILRDLGHPAPLIVDYSVPEDVTEAQTLELLDRSLRTLKECGYL